MKIVIDTNVFIAAVLTKSPTTRSVLEACRTGQVQLVLSKPILREIGYVLHKPKLQAIHQMTDAEISRYLQELATFAEFIPGTSAIQISKDPKDNMFFACAVEASADYIVSGDIKHILPIRSFQGVQTISPADFVEQVLKYEKAA